MHSFLNTTIPTNKLFILSMLFDISLKGIWDVVLPVLFPMVHAHMFLYLPPPPPPLQVFSICCSYYLPDALLSSFTGFGWMLDFHLDFGPRATWRTFPCTFTHLHCHLPYYAMYFLLLPGLFQTVHTKFIFLPAAYPSHTYSPTGFFHVLCYLPVFSCHHTLCACMSLYSSLHTYRSIFIFYLHYLFVSVDFTLYAAATTTVSCTVATACMSHTIPTTTCHHSALQCATVLPTTLPHLPLHHHLPQPATVLSLCAHTFRTSHLRSDQEHYIVLCRAGSVPALLLPAAFPFWDAVSVTSFTLVRRCVPLQFWTSPLLDTHLPQAPRTAPAAATVRSVFRARNHLPVCCVLPLPPAHGFYYLFCTTCAHPYHRFKRRHYYFCRCVSRTARAPRRRF